MKSNYIEKSFARALSQILETAEAMYGTEKDQQEKWQFFRSVLLKRINELKRELKEAGQERNGGEDGYGNERNI